jgi:hypothetical protein
MHADGLSADDGHVRATARRRRGIAAFASAAIAACALLPACAAAATLQATPASLSNVFAAAQPGDTVALASGDYGRFSGAMKSGTVTIKPQPSATARMALNLSPATNITIDGLTLTEIEIGDSHTKNITIRNSDIPGQTKLRTGELVNANILLDHNVHHDFTVCANGCAEGRIWLPDRSETQPTGITISNSEFRGGASDGIQNGSNGTRIINNTFHDLPQGNPNLVHTDAIQLYGSKNTLIKGNYFYNLDNGVAPIMAGDGAERETIEDNVFGNAIARPYAITIWSDTASTIRHNTFADGACEFNLRCGIISLGSKDSCPHPTECDPGRGTTITDNILGEVSIGSGDAQVSQDGFNLFRIRVSGTHAITGAPRYVGGTTPTSYRGYALAPGSPGKGNASDGLDRGIRVGSTAPPPASTRPVAPSSSSVTVRVPSTLRSIQRAGKLRLSVRTTAAGAATVAASVRPGAALREYRGGHSRRAIRLKKLSLGMLGGATRTMTLRVGANGRRQLGRSASARLTVVVSVGGVAAKRTLTIKR